MTCASKAWTWMRPARIPATMRRIPASAARLWPPCTTTSKRELKYQSTDNYRPTAYNLTGVSGTGSTGPPAAGPVWARGAGNSPSPMWPRTWPARSARIPHLKVFSANGYFDLATPFFATEYDIAHMDLPPDLRGNVQFGYYPSGHMIYLNVEALHKLKDDLAAFITSAGK